MSNHARSLGSQQSKTNSEYVNAINCFVEVRNALANIRSQYQRNNVTDAKRIDFVAKQIDNLDTGLRYFDNNTVTELLVEINNRLRLQGVVNVQSFSCLLIVNGNPQLFGLQISE